MKIDLDEDQVRLLNTVVRSYRELLPVSRCRDVSLCDDIVAKLERALDDQVKGCTENRPHVTLELHRMKDTDFGDFKYVVSIAGHGKTPGASIYESDRQKAKKILRQYLYECLKERALA